MGSGFNTLIPGMNGSGDIEIVTHLDVRELLGDLPRSRQVQVPPELVRTWGLPLIEGEGVTLVPVIGVRLLLIEKRPAPEEGGKEVYIWEMLITPFRGETMRRWISAPKNLIVTDREGERTKGSFHMGEEVRRVAHQLSKLRPPKLAVFEVYFHMDAKHQGHMDGIASSSKLHNRHRQRLIADNEKRWKRWRSKTWNWIFHRKTDEKTLIRQGLGPTDLVELPPDLPDLWIETGEQADRILEIMSEFERVLGSLWRATFWNNTSFQMALLKHGWGSNPPRRTIVPVSHNVHRIMRNESALNAVSITDQRLAGLAASSRGAA
jgi:hypothetical protein